MKSVTSQTENRSLFLKTIHLKHEGNYLNQEERKDCFSVGTVSFFAGSCFFTSDNHVMKRVFIFWRLSGLVLFTVARIRSGRMYWVKRFISRQLLCSLYGIPGQYSTMSVFTVLVLQYWFQIEKEKINPEVFICQKIYPNNTNHDKIHERDDISPGPFLLVTKPKYQMLNQSTQYLSSNFLKREKIKFQNISKQQQTALYPLMNTTTKSSTKSGTVSEFCSRNDTYLRFSQV